jgi:copper oxidase (laccase) domain-containing protein
MRLVLFAVQLIIRFLYLQLDFVRRNLGAKKVFVSKICVKEDNRFFSRRRGDNHSQISVVIKNGKE